jgi:hypothetical protein
MWSSLETEISFPGTEKDPGAKEGGLFGWMEYSLKRGWGVSRCGESVLGMGIGHEEQVFL